MDRWSIKLTSPAGHHMTLRLTSSRDDWPAARDCYLASFRDYPLYRYAAPEPEVRDRFLRAYLDANYDVIVRDGPGILFGLYLDEAADGYAAGTLIGSVMFVLPSSDGGGWAIGSDQPYWDAYRKHGLDLISPEALERVERYEAWENAHIAQKARALQIPMYNGVFACVAPRFSNQGIGTTCSGSLASAIYRLTGDDGAAGGGQPSAAVSPIVVAIVQCSRGSNFYRAQGLHPVVNEPYDDAGDVVFRVELLAMDLAPAPAASGVERVRAAFSGEVRQDCKQERKEAAPLMKNVEVIRL